MAKFRLQKNSLIAGELSPTALGRTDLPQYEHACETLKNAIPMTVGGAYRRPGSLFQIEKAAADDYAPRVIPFVASKSEAYALLLGKTVAGTCYIYAYRPSDNHSVPSTASVTGAPPWQPALQTAGTPTFYYDEWHEVQYVQSVDVMWLVHPNYKPYKLSRTAVDTFTLTEFDSGLTGQAFTDAWPYRRQNSSSITMTASHTSGNSRTLTASAAFFDASHVGAVFKLDDGAGTIGSAKVVGFTSSTVVTIDIKENFGATAATLTWWESSWSDYRGWPRSVSFYQQRLAFGGNATERDTVWFSETNDFAQLSHQTHTDPYVAGTPTGSDAFACPLASTQLNLIQWMAPDKNLTIGTQGAEYIVTFNPNATTGFGANNCYATLESAYGSSFHQPADIGEELVFATAPDDELRAFVFNDSQDAYVAEPLQTLFDHYPKAEKGTFKLGDRKYRTFAWDDYRKTLWCCDTMGNLFGLTRDRRLGINAWHTHQMGGYDSTLTGGTVGAGATLTIDPATNICSGSVISLTVLPNPLNGGNDLWLIVKRKIDSSFRYHLERIIGKGFQQDSVADPIAIGTYYADASVYNLNDYPAAEDYIFSGHDHLEGETLEGIASNTNGLFTVAGSAVSSGDTTIQASYPTGLASILTIVSFGLPFSTIIKPVRPEAGSQIGTAQGAIKKLHECSVRFYKTIQAKVGVAADNLETLVFRDGDTPMGESAELFTGDKLVKLESDYDRDGYIYILADKPLPFTVVSISTEGVLYD